MEQHHFVVNEFTLKRGEPKMLNLFCACCKGYLITYQKDGPGPLLRCYWDRIHAPSLDSNENALVCPHCDSLIGKKGVYAKENRLAFFLEEGSFVIEGENEAINDTP